MRKHACLLRYDFSRFENGPTAQVRDGDIKWGWGVVVNFSKKYSHSQVDDRMILKERIKLTFVCSL